MNHSLIAGACLSVLSGVVAAGCGGPGKAAVDPVVAYQHGDYAEALAAAKEAGKKAEGPEKERAQLLAGLSEYALKRPDQASTYLLPLLDSQNPEVAGTAAWTLGSIAFDKGNNAKAVGLLETAAGKLKGDDAARALSLQADASAKLNTPAPVGRLLGYPPSAAVPPGTRYVIQLGAFGDRRKADQLAASAVPAVQQAGFASPRVEQRRDRTSGQGVYAVRVGDYASRPAAEAALARLSVRGTVMANLP